MKKTKYLKKTIIFFLVINAQIFFSVNIFYFINDYKPLKIEKANIIKEGKSKTLSENNIKLLTWNLGNGRFGENEGIIKSKINKSEKKSYIDNNIKNIKELISVTNFDVGFFQEIDYKNSISISNLKNDFDSFFVYNYKDFFLPFKKINIGCLTISKYKAIEHLRISLPLHIIPLKFFTPKSSILTSRINIKDKDIIFMNVHIAIIDKKQKLQKRQLEFLKKIIIEEYDKGNSVIVGGDWNMILPGIEKEKFSKISNAGKWKNVFNYLPDDWKPNKWKWAYSKDSPSIRSTDKPYSKEESFTTTFDGFLLSPDIDVISVEVIDLNFKFSDHQPVYMNIRINE